MHPILRDALLDAWAVLAPTACSGCGAPDRALCESCRAALAAAVPEPVALRRDDGSTLTVWHAVDYRGPVRGILTGFKDGGRTDAARALSAALRASVVAALAAAPPGVPPGLALVAIPSTRRAFRARGYAPVRLLVRRAGLRDARWLRPARQTEDQASLGAQARQRNRRGSLRALPVAAGRPVVIVDDICTTGATLLEADRALREAGAHVLGAATVAYTRRRDGRSGGA